MNLTKGITGYSRVSTLRQVDGFSLTHQTASIERYASATGRTITNIYVEHESGKKHQNRPQFLAALDECKRTGNTLICIRLDRLSRNASFLMALVDSKIDFYCIEQPDLSSPLVLSLMAGIAQSESATIASRVRSSLKVKRQQCEQAGVPFFEGQRKALERVRDKGVQTIKQNALNRRLERKAGILSIFESSGERNLNKTSRILQDLRVPTLTGKGAWTPMSVRRVLAA